jgi:hypothetical protein
LVQSRFVDARIDRSQSCLYLESPSGTGADRHHSGTGILALTVTAAGLADGRLKRESPLTDTVRRLAWQEIHPAAQIPAKATFSVKIRTQESVKKVPQSLAWADKNSGQMLPELLLQGIAWVDRSSFQILRMRTDLLAPKIQFGEVQPGFSEALAGLQTLVTFSEVQSPEVRIPYGCQAKSTCTRKLVRPSGFLTQAMNSTSIGGFETCSTIRTISPIEGR